MQQPQMTVIQRLNDAFATEIMSRPFPVEKLSYSWRAAAKKALEFASPNSLGVNADIFKRLALIKIEGPYQLSFFDFATLSNNLEMRSANELDMTIDTYVVIAIQASELVKYYNGEIALIRKEIEARIAAEDAAQKTDEGALAFGGLKAEA